MKIENVYWTLITGIILFGAIGTSSLDNEEIVAIPCLVLFTICVLSVYLIEICFPEVKADREKQKVGENNNGKKGE